MTPDIRLHAIARGDRAAFTALYRSEYRAMLALATGLLAGDRAAGEDVVDTAFMAIWQSAGKWTGHGDARGWMRRIVRNKAVDWLRQNGRFDLGLETEDMASQADPARDPEMMALAASQSERLGEALALLSLDQREAVMLCYFEELPLADIAAITGAPEGTIKTRLFHARKALRRALVDN